MKSSQAKQIFTEVLLEHLNESQAPNLSAEEQDLYQKGVKLGLADKLKGQRRKLDPTKLPPAFVNGYNQSNKEQSWWDKFNSKVTDYLGRMGSSRLR